MSSILFADLSSYAKTINLQVENAEWYIFGSATDSKIKPNDIDLIIVVSRQGYSSIYRELVDIDRFFRPIHLTIMTIEEERETDFISYQKCIRIA